MLLFLILTGAFTTKKPQLYSLGLFGKISFPYMVGKNKAYLEMYQQSLIILKM